MPTSTAKSIPSPKNKAAWERFSRSQTWAASAKWPIMMRLARTSRIMTQQMEENSGMSMPQVRILFESLDPAGVSQATLHKQYQVDPASITRTVQAMERDGLIVRRMDENDNRYMRVYATEKGRALADALPARMADFEKSLVEGLSDNEILQLHALLERLEERLMILEDKER